MRIDILTLFPEMLTGPLDHSIIGRAREAGTIEIAVHNPREWATDKHSVVDDYAYGGGPGMVMKPEPLFACVEAVRAMTEPPGKVVLLTPQGRLLDQLVVAELAAEPRLIVICGHYEGVDERVREHLADDEISIGDYVLSGGEPAAIVLVDAVARHQPGVLGSERSLTEESHAHGLLEYPQYTRPAEFNGMTVPDVLLSGHHLDIEQWRRRQSIVRTAQRRPDMLARARLTPEELRIAEEALDAPSPEARLFRVILPVADTYAGAAFYARLFGKPGERIAPTRHYFRCGATILTLVDPRGEPSTPDPLSTSAGEGELEGPMSAGKGQVAMEFRPNPDHVYFTVADLAAMYGRARGAGCQWLEPKIRRRPWGERSFYARDPFGNPICFVDETTAYVGLESEPKEG